MTEKFKWANDLSRTFLSRGYLRDGQEVEDRVREIADHAEKLTGIEGFADKFYDYMSRGWFSLSSPVWSNYGTDRGLSVSCFGSYIEDSMSSIMNTVAEVGMLSKFGGGTSGYIGKIRPRGSKIKNNGESFGSVHFMEMFDKLTDIVSQGSVRRGFFTPYIDIEHGDFDEFIGFGTPGHPIQTLTNAVIVSDQFLNDMIAGNKENRRRWAKVLKSRSEVGYPYIFFADTVNNNKPDVYKDTNMKIWASNMCSEITLSSNEDETFVCVLSSINLEHYDDWKNTDAVETITIFLDSVVTEFLNKIEEMDEQTRFFMRKVYNFAKRQRALGVGVLGWHNFLQSKMIPFVSDEATKYTHEIFSHIQEKSLQASKDMAKWWGEPEMLNGYGRRNVTLTAIAPTTSSSFILGQTSSGIEPHLSNYYPTDLAKITTTYKNPYLEKVLEKYGKNDRGTWSSIRESDGSVQHLDFLSNLEKEVFKSFVEINQSGLIAQAAERQKYIDQAQSLNIMIDPATPAKEINKLYLLAWQLGVKTLYYQKSRSAVQDGTRNRQTTQSCASCEA